MPPRKHHGGRGPRAGGGGGQPLSTLAGSALHGTTRNITTLWRAMAKQLPTIRNATHYYAHDVQRLGRGVYEAAAAYREGAAAPKKAAEDGTSPASSDSASESERSPKLRFDTEAHYTPASVDELGVSVRSSELQRVPGLGLVLVLCIEDGFAVFSVDGDGVYELTVALQRDDRAPVLSVVVVSAARAVVATADALCWYDLAEHKYILPAGGKPPRVLADRCSGMRALKDHVAVLSAEYSQVTLYELNDDFTEARAIIADRPVIATSARWLAYCGSSKVAATTVLHSAKQDSATNTVAKSLVGGLSTLAGGLGLGGGGSSPGNGAGPASVTLGSVTVCDAVTGRDFASFNAHEHNLQHMAFDGSGAWLATASVSGTTISVFQIMPGACAVGGPAAAGGSRATATVTLLFRLARGMTAGTVTSIAFSPVNAWAAIATSVGTVHCFAVPQAQRSRPGLVADADSYVAPLLSAACRCRSAPLAKPVNPSVAFHPDYDMRSNRAGIYTAAVSATVSGFIVSEQGAATVLTQHLTQFSAGDDDDFGSDDGGTADNADGASSTAASPTDGGGGGKQTATAAGTAQPAPASATAPTTAAPSGMTADFVWRSAIELRTHPSFPKLRNFRRIDVGDDRLTHFDAAAPSQAVPAAGGDGAGNGGGRSGGGKQPKSSARGSDGGKRGGVTSAAAAATPDAQAVAAVDNEWHEA